MATLDEATGKLTFRKGEIVNLPFTYEDEDTGDPISLTGKPVTFRLTKKDTTRPFLILRTDDAEPTSYGSSVAFTDAAEGAFQLVLTDTETARLAVKQTGTWSFTYEVSGQEYEIYVGKFKVESL